jgi:hypothetical protein
LFTYPETVWQRMLGRACDADEQLVTQLLGLRHVVQGLALVAAPGAVRGPAVATDLTHGLSMVALAGWRPRYARPALTSTAVALAAAVLTGIRRERT